MSEKPTFSKIFTELLKVVPKNSIDPPQDFTIRPQKTSNETKSFNLLFTSNIGSMLQLTTCFVPLKTLDDEDCNSVLHWEPLINDKQLSSTASTLAENLLAERMRCLKQGITFYDFHIESSNLIFINNGLTYSCFLGDNNEILSLDLLEMNNALSVKRNPSNWRLLSYLKNKNVFVIDISNNNSAQLTFSEGDIGSGCTHFVIQEEFERLDGMWWRPIEENKNEYHLLIEEYDESAVSKLIISCYSFDFENEEYRYPQPGKVNAKSTLKILKIRMDPNSEEKIHCEILHLNCDHLEHFPKYEYLVNAGWTSDGQFVWIQVADRLQNCLSTYLLSLNCFSSCRENEARLSKIGYAVLLNKQVNNRFWVPNNVNTVFLKFAQTDSNRYTCSYILGQSLSGFNHLYLKRSSWSICDNPDSFIVLDPDINDTLPLTNGNWEVDVHKIWVNEKEEIVYFLANKDDILASHLYSVCYKDKNKDFVIEHITDRDSVVYLNVDEKVAVVQTSSIGSEIVVELISLKDSMNSPRYKIFKNLHPYNILDNGLNVSRTPKLLKYDIFDEFGVAVPLYGLLYVPDSQTPRKWPTLHYVYGGPSVRLVENSCNRNFLYFAQKINNFGFAFLLCDGRGSSRRGLEFQGHIKNKLGVVELEDQIYFLHQAAQDTGLIDLERVGIYGSSYGGYLTIMAMCRYSNVYKCGFSCSPVTDFKFYDTAYTERYMGIPEENVEAYSKASVMTYLSDLPKDQCRLTIAHGGKDENVHFLHTANLLQHATMLGHHIKFLFYPNSRHGIKDRLHLESHLLKFLFKHLMY